MKYDDTDPRSPSEFNRFSLICSITQHHDKFGVVGTGEGALPIFSDIPYFTSDYSKINGIRKNITAVMLLNCADAAAVVLTGGAAREQIRTDALHFANGVYNCRHHGAPAAGESGWLSQLQVKVSDPSVCLGLTEDGISRWLGDWNDLRNAIDAPEVKGSRGRLKQRLLSMEQSPVRTIERIRRLLTTATRTVGADVVADTMSPAAVETVLVGALGSYQFQAFCQMFASVAKLDYGLDFFKAIVCGCVRKAIIIPAGGAPGTWNNLSPAESACLAAVDVLQISEQITSLFVRVLNGLVTRYAGVLGAGGLDARRFGVQMRDLTTDDSIRDQIIKLLCVDPNKDHLALIWIADEVTIWSMD